MTVARKAATLIVLGALMLAAAITVLARNRSTDLDLLAGIALAGGLAVIVNELPTDKE